MAAFPTNDDPETIAIALVPFANIPVPPLSLPAESVTARVAVPALLVKTPNPDDVLWDDVTRVADALTTSQERPD